MWPLPGPLALARVGAPAHPLAATAALLLARSPHTACRLTSAPPRPGWLDPASQQPWTDTLVKG